MPRGKDPPQLPALVVPTRAVLTVQSPVTDLLLEDAAKCATAADTLEAVAKRVAEGVTNSRDAEYLGGVFKAAGVLRKQSAESLEAAKRRWVDERRGTARGVAEAVKSPQVQKLLNHAKKLIDAAGEAQAAADALPAPTAATVT